MEDHNSYKVNKNINFEPRIGLNWSVYANLFLLFWYVSFVSVKFLIYNFNNCASSDYLNFRGTIDTVVCDWNVMLVYKYYINRVSLSQDHIPSKCFYAVFQWSTKRYDIGLSNEPLFIVIGQVAAKLWHVKVGSPKNIRLRTTSNSILL